MKKVLRTIGVPGLLFAIGLVAGLLVHHQRASRAHLRAGESLGTVGHATDACISVRDEAELNQLASEIEVAKRELRVRTMPPPRAMPSRAAQDLRAAELHGRAASLIGARDTKALFGLVRELTALGEAGFAGALDILLALKEFPGEPLTAGGNNQELIRAFPSVTAGFFEWVLESPDRTPAWVRGLATWCLYHMDDVDSTELLLRALARERDPQIADSLVYYGTEGVCAGMEPLLAGAARQQKAESLRWELICSLGRLGTPESIETLSRLAESEDPELKRLSGYALAAVRPGPDSPGTIYRPKRGDSGPIGLEWGDVVVMLGQTTVSSWNQFEKGWNDWPLDQETTFTVQRRGRLVRILVTKSFGGGVATTLEEGR